MFPGKHQSLSNKTQGGGQNEAEKWRLGRYLVLWLYGASGAAVTPARRSSRPGGGPDSAVSPHPRLKDAAVMVVDVESSLWVTHSSFF